jgi:hypothetical protein
MNRTVTLFLLVLLLSSGLCACGRSAPVVPADLRGVPKEQLQERREEILSRHADGSSLSQRETAEVEALRDQERRLENPWIFGEWQDRHGARLIFRDDGSVSVGARGGYYDELGIYKFTSPEQPAYESTWTLTYDEEGKPVVLVARPDGDSFLYPFHDARRSVHEQQGDLQTAVETGFIFKKNQ